MEKTCWFCRRNTEELKKELPKGFWPKNCKLFVNFEIEGKLKAATAPFTTSNKLYEEDKKYEFIMVQKSVCLICLQIMDIENENTINRVSTYDGISLSPSERIGIYSEGKFHKIADEMIFAKQYNDRLNMIKILEENFGSVYAEVIIEEILSRRNSIKPNVRLDDEYFKTKLLVPRLGKRLEEFRHINSSMRRYNLKGEKLTENLIKFFQQLQQNNDDSFEFNEKTDILSVKNIDVFFKVLERQQRSFRSKLNEYRKTIQYSKEDAEKLYEDMLSKTN